VLGSVVFARNAIEFVLTYDPDNNSSLFLDLLLLVLFTFWFFYFH